MTLSEPSDGVVVGADLSQEWLLPWWWKHYRKYNSHPVLFVDLGMSFEMKDWCKQRGPLIRLRVLDDFVKEKNEVAPHLVSSLEEEFGKHFWDSRVAWFKKPLACLQSPFRRSLWIDLDCEIRGPLTPLFAYADPFPGIAMARDLLDTAAHPIYNSGVIAFRKNQQLLTQWAHACFHQNHAFRGDQEVFSHLIAQNGIALSEIPAPYNWSRCHKDASNAVVLHWHGVYGKFVIREQLNCENIP